MNMHATPLRAWIAVFFLCAVAALHCESAATAAGSIGKTVPTTRFRPLFPYALTRDGAEEIGNRGDFFPVSVPTADDLSPDGLNRTRFQSVLLNHDVFALYGKPGSNTMGILGQYPIEKIEPIMNDFVSKYDEANGRRGIVPAFYIIFGTCWPEGEIGILQDSVVRKYVEFARERGWYVFLDHQIGRYPVESAVKKLLPYLQYPNVHLALDPEWRTTKPMKEIGSVTAAELNTAQQMIQDYLIEHNLPGRRMLVVHQFKPKMIMNRASVRSDFELVQLIHCADGFGSPSLKKTTYAMNAAATNIPLKSFKLFLKPTIANAGWDEPIMSPAEVFQLNPRPCLIMYQ